LKEVFQSLAEVPIRMVSYGGSHNNISVLVDASKKEKALNLLNEGLFHL
jgi:aspartate kinase